MGTRHLITVISEEKTKVAQYGQWDGYPSGQGETVLNFLKHKDLGEFKQKVDDLRFLTEKEVESMESTWRNTHPHLSRDVGGDILMLIYSGGVKELVNSESFAADSLFCEWAYVIDLDKGVLEVYEGFNQSPLKEGDRFFALNNHKERSSGYNPVRLAKSYPLNNLPDVDTFVADLEKDEEE